MQRADAARAREPAAAAARIRQERQNARAELRRVLWLACRPAPPTKSAGGMPQQQQEQHALVCCCGRHAAQPPAVRCALHRAAAPVPRPRLLCKRDFKLPAPALSAVKLRWRAAGGHARQQQAAGCSACSSAASGAGSRQGAGSTRGAAGSRRRSAQAALGTTQRSSTARCRRREARRSMPAQAEGQAKGSSDSSLQRAAPSPLAGAALRHVRIKSAPPAATRSPSAQRAEHVGRTRCSMGRSAVQVRRGARRGAARHHRRMPSPRTQGAPPGGTLTPCSRCATLRMPQGRRRCRLPALRLSRFKFK